MYSPLLQMAGALGLVVGVWALAVVQFRILPRLRRRTARDLLTFSSLAIVAGMALAALYAVGEFTETWWVDIEFMSWSHGLLNGVGFVLCGLAAWIVERRTALGV